jgi:DNA-binding LacI/PurR family transcriptional regulator
MMLIVNYLCRSGEHPVYFDMPDVNENAYQRRKAYSQSMEKLGHEPIFAVSGTSDTWDFENFAFNQTTAILSRGDFATRTVLCANDRLAFGVLAACYQAGVKVGRGSDCRLRVAGHDNQPLSALTCPPLTTVSQNYEDIGRIATEILLAKLGASDLPAELIDNQALLNAELVLRESA